MQNITYTNVPPGFGTLRGGKSVNCTIIASNIIYVKVFSCFSKPLIFKVKTVLCDILLVLQQHRSSVTTNIYINNTANILNRLLPSAGYEFPRN